MAVEGSYASVIGGAPAAAVVFARDVRQRAAELTGDDAQVRATAELAARFDGIHTVERAREVGSIDDIIPPERLRPYVVGVLDADRTRLGEQAAAASTEHTLSAPPSRSTTTER